MLAEFADFIHRGRSGDGDVEIGETILHLGDEVFVQRIQSRAAVGGDASTIHQAQRRPPDLTLHFAPIKKARTDFIVEKATELGCARIQPVFTRHTNSERLRLDRLRAHAIEAAEQCGETYVPELAEPVKLDRLLDGWDPARRLVFCDESREARPAAEMLAAEAPGGPWAILIGPEGGFAPEEAARLRALPFVRRVTLGPRVLRADTAAVAAITLWQASLGDWR